jgi:hypothetical protein
MQRKVNEEETEEEIIVVVKGIKARESGTIKTKRRNGKTMEDKRSFLAVEIVILHRSRFVVNLLSWDGIGFTHTQTDTAVTML